MKRTVLDMTQEILSSLSSDEVNSIGDTPESMQIATILKTVYYNILARGDLEEHNQLFQLTASGDATSPVLMFKPDGVSRVNWIKYYNPDDGDFDSIAEHDINTDIIDNDTSSSTAAKFYEYVTILPVVQFIDMVSHFNLDDSDVVGFNFQGFNFRYMNDKKPQYCTCLQDYYFIFDSYQASVDSTLEATKTMCFGQIQPVFLLEDHFIPNLDDKQFPLLLNEAKSLAWYELKTLPHPKSEQESKRQWSVVQKNKSITNKPSYFDQIPNFGRRAWGASWSPFVFKSSRQFDTGM